jgi:hypothetical protein
MKQHVDSVVGPLGLAEALEEVVGDGLVCLEARPEETAEEGEPKVRATRAAAPVREDAVGVHCGTRHQPAGFRSAHTVEEGDGEVGPICDTGRTQRTWRGRARRGGRPGSGWGPGCPAVAFRRTGGVRLVG